MLNTLKRWYWRALRIEHVPTIRGHERCDRLIKSVGSEEDHRARAEWVEYRDSTNEIVHRSVTIALKQGVDLGGTLQELN